MLYKVRRNRSEDCGPPHLEDAGREKTVTVLDGQPVQSSVKFD